MTHRARILIATLLPILVGLSFALSLIWPVSIAVATAALGTALLSWPLLRIIKAQAGPLASRQTLSNREDLHQLGAASFAGLIAGAFRSLGFTVEAVDYRGDTYLADFILQHEQRGEIVVAIARQQRPQDHVDVPLLNTLILAVRRLSASRGILVTTGRIPPEVRRAAEASDVPLQLIDAPLLQRIVEQADDGVD